MLIFYYFPEFFIFNANALCVGIGFKTVLVVDLVCRMLAENIRKEFPSFSEGLSIFTLNVLVFLESQEI